MWLYIIINVWDRGLVPYAWMYNYMVQVPFFVQVRYPYYKITDLHLTIINFYKDFFLYLEMNPISYLSKRLAWYPRTQTADPEKRDSNQDSKTLVFLRSKHSDPSLLFSTVHLVKESVFLSRRECAFPVYSSTLTVNLLKVPSGQIGSAWEWYHWKAL